MKKLIVLLALLCAAPASAADTKVSDMTNASALDGNEEMHCVQSTNDRACAVSQIVTLVEDGLNSEAELEALVADMANIIQAAEIDTEAKLVALVSDLASILQITDIDTLAELNAILTDATLVTGAHTVEVNDLESVATSAGDGEVFVGTGVGTGAYVAGLAACAADEKIEYVPGAPDTFTCEAIGSLVEADISDLSHFSPNADPSVDHASYVAGHGDGANCSAGSYPLGVDASGAVESCTDATTEIDSAISTHTGNASAHHAATVDTTCDGADCNLRDSTLVSCDSVDTDASGNLVCGTDATGAGGSAITFDIGDDGGDDSTDVNEIATTGDTNSIFTESAADKILIAVGNNWPTADAATALSANGANCAAGEIPLGVDASGAVEGCYEPTEADISDLVHTTDTTLTQEEVEDFVGSLLNDGTGTYVGISFTYQDASQDFDVSVSHDDTAGFVANEHIDWTGASAGTIHATNYVDNDTVFSPNADPSVDHSSYVAGHGNGANCSAGSYPLGVDAAGAVESCTDATTEIDSAISTHTGNASAHHTATVDTNTLGPDGDKGDITVGGTGTTLTIDADSVALGTDTTGGYAASVSEAGPATTATALAANGSNCSAGSYALGVNASGAAESCTDATTEIDSAISTHAGSASAHHTKTTSASELTSGTVPAARVGAAHIDTLTEIASALKSGSAADLITGTAGTNGNCAEWSNGDLVDSGGACGGGGATPKHSLCRYIEYPVSNEEFYTIWRAPEAVTIVAIYGEVTGGTSVAFDLEVDDGTPTGVNGSNITATTSGVEDASLAGDTTLADGNRLDLDFGTVTGTVSSFAVCWEFTYD